MTSNWRLASAPIDEGGTAINDTAINGTPTIRAQVRRFIARPQLIASYYTHDTHEAGAQNQSLPVITSIHIRPFRHANSGFRAWAFQAEHPRALCVAYADAGQRKFRACGSSFFSHGGSREYRL
jgi:hypothetical protein